MRYNGGMKYQHFAKPHKAIKLVKNKWVDLTFTFKGKVRKRFYADRNGTLEAVLYLPIQYTEGGPEPEVVRVRLVRGVFKKKPLDPTGYDERLLVAPDGYARIRFFYKGTAEAGRAYHWQVRYMGDGSAQTTGTHYADWWRK